MCLCIPSPAFIEGIGGPEMLLIFVIVLLLFGGQKLPEFARGLGKSIREFKKAATGVEEEFRRALDEDAQKKNPPPPAPYPPAVSSASGEPASPELVEGAESGEPPTETHYGSPDVSATDAPPAEIDPSTIDPDASRGEPPSEPSTPAPAAEAPSATPPTKTEPAATPEPPDPAQPGPKA